MSQSRYNIPLIRKTLEYITEHPEEWNQGTFFSRCGTTMCFAGTALWLNGDANRYGDERSFADSPGSKAAEILGFTRNEYVDRNSEEWRVFYDFQDEDPRELWELLSDITNGEIEVPEELK